jgi:uncharacterized membrane protein
VDWSNLFSTLGIASISVALLVLGALSRRMGKMTRTRAYYVGFYVAAVLVAVGVIARLVNSGYRVAPLTDLHHNIMWILLYNGSPAVGVTLGVFIAWRYWSWLLAERS